MENALKIIPLGGCGEIGMNMTILQVDNLYYFIDCGALFPDAGLPGVDLVVPDVDWLIDNQIRPEAWLITHGHEDHIGALPHLYSKFQAPIYASEFTQELIKEKFGEAKIDNVQFRLWQPGMKMNFRNIKVTPYVVNHSIAHSLGFFIETKHGNILHTGDFRIDYNPPEKTLTHENMAKVIEGKPVAIMLSDSTNSFQKGTDQSENDMGQSFEDIMTQTTGAVAVATFASNIWRIQSVVDAAEKHGRKVYFLGRSLRRNFEIATRLNLLTVQKDTAIGDDMLSVTPKSQLCVVCTGSQGESFSGLNRLSYNLLEGFKLAPGDAVVFSARAIPGNEKAIAYTTNQLYRLGCNVITARDKDVHVSGHGYQEDLKTCIKTVKPKYFMPVHGEFRHLRKHAELAQECGVLEENCFVAENGDVVAVGPHGYGVIDRVNSGRYMVSQGGVLLSWKDDVFKTRLTLGKSGICSASFVLPRSGFELVIPPMVSVKGVPVDEQKLLTDLPRLFSDAVSAGKGRKDYSDALLQEELRILIRRNIEQHVNYKCLVNVFLQRTPH